VIREEEQIIVDGQQGVLIVNPDELVLSEYRRRQRAWRDAKRKLSSIRKSDAKTRDGTVIELLANIELPQDVDVVKAPVPPGWACSAANSCFWGATPCPPRTNSSRPTARWPKT
jgi:phosphotransferase system enzyme I (PtsI)